MKNKMELLGSAPVPEALLAVGIPTMTGMMISAVYNLVDAYFVGGLGTGQMGAISVTYPISQIVVGLGLLFGNGAASYISRLLGQKRHIEADSAASTAIYVGLSAGVVFIIVSLLLLTQILRLFGATDSILPYARSYAGIFIAASILNIFNVMMNNIVSSEGAAKISMLAMLSGAVINMILDPIFISTIGLGVKGAAIASAIGQALSTVCFLGYILTKKSMFSFNIKVCRFSKENMTEIFKIGVPTFIFQLLTSLSLMLINDQANGLTDEYGKAYVDSVIAGMGAVTRVISMGSLMVFGFIKGLQPIAGFSYGARNFDRLRKSIRVSVIWSGSFCLIFGLTVSLFSRQIISAFTHSDSVMISIGKTALFANGLSFILFGFYTVYSSVLLALGKGKSGFFLGACRQGICFIPVILILPSLTGISGITYAQTISDVVSTIIAVIIAVLLNKKLKLEEKCI